MSWSGRLSTPTKPKKALPQSKRSTAWGMMDNFSSIRATMKDRKGKIAAKCAMRDPEQEARQMAILESSWGYVDVLEEEQMSVLESSWGYADVLEMLEAADLQDQGTAQQGFGRNGSASSPYQSSMKKTSLPPVPRNRSKSPFRPAASKKSSVSPIVRSRWQ